MTVPPEHEAEPLIAIRDMIGASDAISVQQLAMYLPDRDRDGNEIEDMDVWIDEALALLSKIGGGATALLNVLGAWINPVTQTLIREETTIVYTYVLPEKFVQQIPELRGFLHEFGHETNQGEVLFHWAGTAYRITEFDPPPALI